VEVLVIKDFEKTVLVEPKNGLRLFVDLFDATRSDTLKWPMRNLRVARWTYWDENGTGCLARLYHRLWGQIHFGHKCPAGVALMKLIALSIR
jgi:hypothetical protein